MEVVVDLVDGARAVTADIDTVAVKVAAQGILDVRQLVGLGGAGGDAGSLEELVCVELSLQANNGLEEVTDVLVLGSTAVIAIGVDGGHASSVLVELV